MTTFIRNGNLLVDGELRSGELTTESGVIRRVRLADGSVGDPTPKQPQPEVEIDATGLTVAPGFVDLQINGGFGNDFLRDPRSMWTVGTSLAEHGVTAFLPTIVTSPTDRRNDALTALADEPASHRGARPLGLHLEGPLLSEHRRGAHRARYLAVPGDVDTTRWTRRDGVVMVTLAPELPGADDTIGQLSDAGVIVALGHSDATAEETAAAIDAGARSVTHLFNAMRPLHHRDPGLTGTALTDERLHVGMIADGIHVHPTVVDLAWRAKGPEGVILVTDAVAAMGRSHGTYDFADGAVTADGGVVRNGDGVLAGSTLTMDAAVRNLVAFTGCDPTEALRAASTTPCELLGDTTRGAVRQGARADLTFLDAELRVVATMIAGHLEWEHEEFGRRTSKGDG